MRKTLLLDNNFSSYPFLNTSYCQDFEQHYCGRRRGYKIGDMADRYWDLNYADEAEVIALIQDQKIDRLIPGCSDISYLMGSKLSEVFPEFRGLDSYENSERINNKQKFRQTLLSLGLPSPATLTANSVHEYEKVIVKPTDSYSGQGIRVLNKPDAIQLQDAIAHAKAHSPTGAYIIEEFADGQLYSHSAFLRNGKIKADFIVEEHCVVNAFRVDTSWICAPEDCHFLEELRKTIEVFAQEFDLVDGLIHTQFIANQETFWIVEMMRRCPGDLYSQLINLSTNFSYCDAYIQPFLGQEYIEDSVFSAEKVQLNEYIVRHTAHIEKDQVFRGIALGSTFNIRQIIPLKSGHVYDNSNHDSRAAIIFFSIPNKSQLERLVGLIRSQNLYSLS